MTSDALSALERQCKSCSLCSLCQSRSNLVFGSGDGGADVMFVGEGPGLNEDREGLPFVGASGRLLDKYFSLFDIKRDKNIYITNTVKCRPPQNREPTEQERQACIGWLRKQFVIIRPKIIVCLGRVAAQTLIAPDFKITSQHGRFYEKSGVYMTATFHPSALLRNPSQNEAALSDFQTVFKKCEQLGIRL